MLNTFIVRSKTVCSEKDWEDFKTHKTFWDSSAWLSSSDNNHVLNKEDIIDASSLFEKFKDFLNGDSSEKEYLRIVEYGIELEKEIFKWLRENIKSLDDFTKYYLLSDYSFKVKLKDKITVCYPWEIEPVVYSEFTLYSIHAAMSAILETICGLNDLPFFYGDGDWNEETSNIKVSSNKSSRVVFDIKSGETFENEDFIISRNGDTITFEQKSTNEDLIIIEKDEEIYNY